MSTGDPDDEHPELAPTQLSPDGTQGAPVVEVRAGDVLDGKYELSSVLGEGGMGMVWKGTHLGLGIPVAVKTLRPEVAAKPDYARRFRREAHAASLLNHQNVVRVLDFGEHGSTLYLVMEYLVGSSLADWVLDHDEPMPLAEVARIMSALCDACALAHSFGIVHRDLKPGNVFLSGPERVVKVVDFGLAHVDDVRDQGPTLTSADVIAGTPEYMSPEQCRSLAVGPSTDLYALGAILTEMLQRRPPFIGGASIEILAKQMFAEPPTLKRPANAEPVPVLLERLRLDLLAKLPEQRPQDAAEVKARLIEAMSADATLARLPTRKGDEPLGDRAARAQEWQRSPAPHDGKTRSLGPTPPVQRQEVGLVRVSAQGGGVDDAIATGLASHAIHLRLLADVGDSVEGLGAIVLDGGHATEATLAALGALHRAHPETAVLVCAAELGTEVMNALVAAGASDVLRYPVAADKLARKLTRIIRHRR